VKASETIRIIGNKSIEDTYTGLALYDLRLGLNFSWEFGIEVRVQIRF